MIAVRINTEGFEYDIHSLVKAFYPKDEVKVFLDGTKSLFSDADKPAIIITRYADDANGEYQIRIRVLDGTDHSSEAESREVILSSTPSKSEIRNGIKQIIYQSLSKYTEHDLPWGSLTGIRPTKIAMSLLQEGKSDTEVSSYLKEQYFTSDLKIKLGIDIAKRERDILAHIHHENGYSLYIGIPFCPTTCLYCSFTSNPICSWASRVDDYLSALEKEIKASAEIMKGKILDTVYIGGGTPTTLSHFELKRLIEAIKTSFDWSHVCEFTVEAGRADSITREKLLVLKELGVTRISVNPQTMNDITLQRIGRQHSVRQVIEAFALAREIGFTNINMDLILGLPGEGEGEVAHTLSEIEKLKPDSLTVHTLALKRGSRLVEWIEQNGWEALREPEKAMELAVASAEKMHLYPYYLYRQKNMSGNFENVGYAREGCYGIYNILIMEEIQSIIALGAGSISKRVDPDGRIERCDNVKDVNLYMEKIDEMIERKRKLFCAPTP
ncbi:MAG: coproporphyrinogen dehydrogenase HemZ [Lachnospiraceae bacterium]|nr:coproporphyrinogen dehydrogenase HemZ [Lachnospiraceae bacterium]